MNDFFEHYWRRGPGNSQLVCPKHTLIFEILLNCTEISIVQSAKELGLQQSLAYFMEYIITNHSDLMAPLLVIRCHLFFDPLVTVVAWY